MKTARSPCAVEESVVESIGHIHIVAISNQIAHTVTAVLDAVSYSISSSNHFFC